VDEEDTAGSESPERGPGSRRRRIVFFGVSGALILGALLLFRGVLLPFLLAIVVAYVFAPVVKALQRLMPRWIAVLLLYLALLGALGAFIAYGVPRLAVEVERLARETPRAVRTVQYEWLPALEGQLRDAMRSYSEEEGLALGPTERRLGGGSMGEGVDGGVPPAYGMDAGVPRGSSAIVVTPTPSGGYQIHLPPDGIFVRPEGDRARGYVVGAERPEEEAEGDFTTSVSEAFERQMKNTEAHAVTAFKTVQAVVKAVVRGVFGFFIMLMLSAYLLITSDRIFAFLRSLVRPERSVQFDDLLRRIDRGLSGVVRGQLLIALVNGVLSGIGFYLFDLPYWPILTLIATLLSIIPIFGSILSSIPAVLIGLQQGIGTALLVLAWIVGIHQLEANVLNPKIMGDSAKVHPVLVVFALLAGEHIFGIVGALLAVPVLSIAQSLFLHYKDVALGRGHAGSSSEDVEPDTQPDTG